MADSKEHWDFNRLLTVFIDSTQKQTEAFNNVAGAIHEMNDKNALHFEQDTDRMDIVEANTIATHELIKSQEKYYKLFSKVVIIFVGVFVLLILAILVLAGAEKAVQLFPDFFGGLI